MGSECADETETHVSSLYVNLRISNLEFDAVEFAKWDIREVQVQNSMWRKGHTRQITQCDPPLTTNCERFDSCGQSSSNYDKQR